MDMNQRAGHQFEDEAAIYMPASPDSIPRRTDPISNARVALIPLVRRTSKSSLADKCTHLERLVITVQLDPALVRQRWVLDIPGDTRTHVRGEALDIDTCRNSACSRVGGYDSVEYHLPRTTLNEFTDTHGFQRISTDLEGIPSECPVFIRLTHLAMLSVETPERFSPSFMDHFVMLFCAHVVQLLNVGVANKRLLRGGLSASQKRRAIEMLSKGTCVDVRLSVVASRCGLSVSHFARSFKISFGQPVHRWVVGQRVERAKQLLLCSDEPLIDIAYDTGFSDQASFNRTFAKVTGTSPGRWRRDFKP
jgi:AraC-like DNA-binding protein